MMPKIELIQEDYRGASYQLLFPDNREAVLIFTKAGFYRGGHSHSKPEISLILSGRLKNWKRTGDLELTTEKGEGEFMMNSPGEPHVTLAITDYWLLDWKLGAKIGESVSENYPPYRKFVDEQKPKS